MKKTLLACLTAIGCTAAFCGTSLWIYKKALKWYEQTLKELL